MWDVIMGLEFLLPFIIVNLCLNIFVTYIVSKVFNNERLILKGIFVGGILSIMLLITIWAIYLTNEPGGGEDLTGLLTLTFFGQPLSWFALLPQLSPGNLNVSMVICSLSLLLDWCGFGAFAGWLIQKIAGWKRKKGLEGKVGEIPHHNI